MVDTIARLIVCEITTLNKQLVDYDDYGEAMSRTCAIQSLCRVLAKAMSTKAKDGLSPECRQSLIKDLNAVLHHQPKNKIAGGPALPYDDITKLVGSLIP
jgi:hypothetical protein